MTTPEVRTLVPKQILERAQSLAENGLYSNALELLERNKMEFEIYDTFMKMRLPVPKKREYHCEKVMTKGVRGVRKTR